MSEFFPMWITADAILSKEIAPCLGAYASADAANSSVNISYLPDDILFWVPEEDAGTFIQRYDHFNLWASDALNIKKLLEPMLYSSICNATLVDIENRIENRIKEYDSKDKLSFQTKFLEFMGISPICQYISFTLEYDADALRKALEE